MKEYPLIPKKAQNVPNLFPSCCEKCERGELTTLSSHPTHIPHFLAEKVHCHVAGQCHSPELPILEKERHHFT